MGKSLFDDIIGNADIDIDCPGCGKKINIKMKQIGTTIKCPRCQCSIKLEESGDGLSGVKRSLDKFEKTLKNL